MDFIDDFVICNLFESKRSLKTRKCNNRWGKCRWVGRSCRPSKIISLLRFESLLLSTWAISSNCNQFGWRPYDDTLFCFRASAQTFKFSILRKIQNITRIWRYEKALPENYNCQILPSEANFDLISTFGKWPCQHRFDSNSLKFCNICVIDTTNTRRRNMYNSKVKSEDSIILWRNFTQCITNK